MTTWIHHGQMGYNGNVTCNQGYRQVSFDPYGEVSPVLFAVRSGHIPNRATCQMVQKGCYILHVTVWSHKSPARITFHEVTDVRNDIFTLKVLREETVARTSIRDVLKSMFLEIRIAGCSQKEEVINFLCGVLDHRVPSLLPDGLGWTEDLTMSDRGKLRKFDNFIEELLKDGAMTEDCVKNIKRNYLIVTPSKALNYDWSTALPIDTFWEVVSKLKTLSSCYVCKEGKWKQLPFLNDDAMVGVSKVIIIEYDCFKNAEHKQYGMRITLLTKGE